MKEKISDLFHLLSFSYDFSTENAVGNIIRRKSVRISKIDREIEIHFKTFGGQNPKLVFSYRFATKLVCDGFATGISDGLSTNVSLLGNF